MAKQVYRLKPLAKFWQQTCTLQDVSKHESLGLTCSNSLEAAHDFDEPLSFAGFFHLTVGRTDAARLDFVQRPPHTIFSLSCSYIYKEENRWIVDNIDLRSTFIYRRKLGQKPCFSVK